MNSAALPPRPIQPESLAGDQALVVLKALRGPQCTNAAENTTLGKWFLPPQVRAKLLGYHLTGDWPDTVDHDVTCRHQGDFSHCELFNNQNSSFTYFRLSWV